MERELVDLRSRELRLTGTTRRCLNLGSYNYLGFAAHDEFCTDRVKDTVVKYGASMCTPRMDLTTDLLLDFERLVARYVGKEAAIVFGMGFATNSANIPMLIGKGGLIVSDALNHSSIVTGARASGAKVKVFQHNVPADLERLLRSSIAEGQPRTHRPWKKILVIVEGIYSMEGEVCRLPEIVAICKKYKAYIFLDEAHSIGALGRTGRGVCEHTGVDPANIDIMMGTFTKSFGSCGGYVAGDKGLIDYLRCNGPASIFATGMSPPAVQQALSALTVIMGEDGTDRGVKKIAALHDNSNWFRSQLRKIGCEVLGDRDSPVMPVMLYHPGKIPAFSRKCLERNVAVVVVGFPATPLLLARVRVCISASHSREDLKKALEVFNDVSEEINIRYGNIA
eukprot:jgi/Mesvir1/23172/Mv22644-RA.2